MTRIRTWLVAILVLALGTLLCSYVRTYQGGTGTTTTFTAKSVVYAGTNGVYNQDNTNFQYTDTANANYLTLGGGTAGGELRQLEGSGGGTNYTASKSAAVLSANRTIDPRAAIIIYASTAASAAHTGSTAAETTVMPQAADGTAATNLGVETLLTGSVFNYDVFVPFTGDADGDETLTVNVYFGAQLVGTSGAVAVDGAGMINLAGQVNIWVSSAVGTGQYSGISSATATPAPFGATFGSFDCTATQAFAVKLDWGGTTDADDSATVSGLNLTWNNYTNS